MLFADLSRERSPAQRVILYPSVWDEQRESQKAMTPYLETSMRLLQRAAKRYGVRLLPIKPILGLGVGSVMAYPLAGLFSLTTFDRLVYLRPSGLMLNSSPLDDLFTTPMNTSLATLSAGSAELPVTPSIVLLRPSTERYRDFATSLSAAGYSDEAFLQNSAPIVEKSPISGRETVRLLAETSALEFEGDDFNMTSFFAGTSYVHIQDIGMPGPEYDAPRDAFLRSRPSGFQARGAWEDVYETYRTKRMDICGLDLEPVGLAGGGDDDGASGLPAFVEETV
ncbi:Nucleotide-diphospho-sugar transferases [Lasallia pustulata]|nr:Nucleotide-diphospho-sugar transferases [Lasallia pustulata]